MMFLSINTATDICSVSVYNENKFITLSEGDTKEHSKYLPLFTKELIASCKDKLKYIALCIGPGSFTGLKIGSSFAKGLANSLNIPIIPINIFDSFRSEIKNINKYYLAVYSHQDYAFSCFNNDMNISESKCNKIEHMIKYPVFGYGFPEKLKITYNEIRPCSEKTGILSLDKINEYSNSNINDINPIYLYVEK